MRPTDHDFEATLRACLKRMQPGNVLEWGPGRSTEIVHEECPAATITSIESQEAFATSARKRFGAFAEIVHVPIPVYGPSLYAAWPLLQMPKPVYDLIFIDGRRRVECLMAARLVIRQGHPILLHDAGRAAYRHVFDLFRILEDAGRTVAMTSACVGAARSLTGKGQLSFG